MILKNHKTCNHCPAFHDGVVGQICVLGYLTEKAEGRIWPKYTTWQDLTVKIKPAEPCPRPKNIGEMVEIRKVIDIHRYANPKSPEYKKMWGDDQMMTPEQGLEHYIRLKPDE